MREPLPDEDTVIDEAYVCFVFKYEAKDARELASKMSLKILSDVKTPDAISTGKKDVNVKEFFEDISEVVFFVDIAKKEKYFSLWSLTKGYELLENLYKPTEICSDGRFVPIGDKLYELKKYRLVNLPEFRLKQINQGYLEKATIGDLRILVHESLNLMNTENSLKSSVFWEYNEKDTLPGSVNMTDFSNDPDMCPPLKNMFILAGVRDIKTDLGVARKNSRNRFKNYLERIAIKTTKYLHSVWDECRDVQIVLEPDGDQILLGVKEINTHDFSRRSDGFKKLVIFFLMISSSVKTNNMKNTLLLIDEPETSLHPSGAKYLRDELIRVAQNNYLVYSTHSIFMIDPDRIDRHYIVKKDHEITEIEQAKESNIKDEEVLFNALGYSVFEAIDKKVLIFEGWRDKKLFYVARDSSSKALKDKYEKVGICHAKGARNIKAVTSLIDLAKRKCLIVSDSDEASRREQEKHKTERGYGDWEDIPGR